MRFVKGSGTVRLEARVELDDELLVNVLGHLFARGQTHDGGLDRLGIHREPARDIANAVFLEAARGELTGSRRVLNLDLVARLHVVAGDVDLVAIHADVTVVHELTRRSAALREAEEIDGAIEAALEELQE